MSLYGSLFRSTTIPVLQQTINFSEERHAVLAGNIANVDTPGYEFRDLSVEDFQQRLQEAIRQRDEPAQSRSPGDPSPPPAEDPVAEIAEHPHTILHHDKSNVSLENEVTEMVKNQMQHNLALTIMTSQFRLLQTAISEKV